MKIPGDTVLPSLFMGNFFCLIPHTNLAFVVISKNAVTFLKKVAIYNDTKEWTDSDKAHAKIGYHEESPYLIPIEKMHNHEKQNGVIVKFAVWRDPIERILSTYKLFCLEKEYRSYFHFLGLYEDNSFDRFMQFLRFEWSKKVPLFQDEHIRRQIDYYQIQDVDFIVPIHKLYDFLNDYKVAFIKEKTNKTTCKFIIESKENIKEIKLYYKKDWEIRCNYQ